MKKATLEKTEEKKEKKIEGLNPKVFDGEVNKALLYQVLRMYEANQRQGTASTKTRAAVSGGGRKPWAQKHTGRARAGSIRSPLWRGGGDIFGPHPRDYSYTLPQKIRQQALRSVLNSKYNERDLVVLDDIKVDNPKTKEFKKILTGLKLDNKVLFVLESIDENLRLASRNLKEVALRRAADLNALDILKFKKLVLTRPALLILEKKLVRAGE
ncbi:MAG: 50S ribosomal protein L4 [Candidatus Omnitrophica bacterium]|nr:50S ribosomal protein L4 [Candidatus Omnitrophota bacterium]